MYHNAGGIKFTNISRGMILEVVRLVGDGPKPVRRIMGDYLVVRLITKDLIKRYKKPMMEVQLANLGRSSSALTFWIPKWGIYKLSFPGRKVPFKFNIKKQHSRVRGI
ncbi:MAG: hypothetical protein ABIJ81_00260 [Patescibacteria group bacterium]